MLYCALKIDRLFPKCKLDAHKYYLDNFVSPMFYHWLKMLNIFLKKIYSLNQRSNNKILLFTKGEHVV